MEYFLRSPCLQIREIRVDYREATGPCKARSLAQKLWAGEEFYLQLDAHMRFAHGWDEALIQWLRQAEAEHPESKPVISTYPPGYEVCSMLRSRFVCWWNSQAQPEHLWYCLEPAMCLNVSQCSASCQAWRNV